MKLLWSASSFFLAVVQCHAIITWQMPPEDISTPFLGSLPSSDFQAGLDASGNGVAVWVDTTLNHVYSNAFIAGVWGPSFDVSGPGAGTTTTLPVVAVAANGNAVAVWVDTGANNIYGATKPFGANWTIPVVISIVPSNGTEPSVGVDANGNAVAVWVDNATGNIFAATMPFGGAWTVPVSVSVGVAGATPQVAVAANGNAVAVWRDATLATGDIFSASLPSGGSWSAPIDASSSTKGTTPRIGVDANGNAVAIWQDNSGGPNQDRLFAATLSFGFAWSASLDVSLAKVSPTTFRVAVNANGIAAAIWNEIGHAMVSRLILGSWEIPTDVSVAPGKEPDVGIAANGDAIVSWIQGPDIIYVSQRAFAASAWDSPVDVSSPFSANGYPEVAVSSNGDAVILFQDILNQIIATNGLAPPVPTNLQGTQVLHRFPAQGDLINELSWTVNGNVAFFHIYRNSLDKLIKVTKKTHFEDHQRKPGKTVTYFIVAVDVFGVASAPVSIVVAPAKL